MALHTTLNTMKEAAEGNPNPYIAGPDNVNTNIVVKQPHLPQSFSKFKDKQSSTLYAQVSTLP